MRLLGAKEFLKTVKPGTLFISFWLDNAKQCFELARLFEAGESVQEISKKYWDEFHIFGDNGGSVAFCKTDDEPPVDIKGHSYDCIFYYDHNIVGDAGPGETLNLVFDNEAEWPSEFRVSQSDQILSKEDVVRIRDWFLETEGPFKDEANDWARAALEEGYYKDDPVVNYKFTR